MIAGMDYDERSALPCIGNERADLVVAGCAILEAIIEIWPAENLGRCRPRHPRGHFALADGPRRLATVKRVKTAKGRKVSSTRWLERQLNDPYVRRAKAENYRSRAAYKLIELDERFGLLKGVKAVVDLGIAPGGWSQVVRRKVPGREGRRHRPSADRSDRRRHHPADGLHGRGRAGTAAGGARRTRPTSSFPTWRRTPSAISRPTTCAPWRLVEAGLEFAREVLRPGGAYVAKVLAGGADSQLVAELKRSFATVKHAKPPASRKDSSEWYVVAQGFKGDAGTG